MQQHELGRSLHLRTEPRVSPTPVVNHSSLRSGHPSTTGTLLVLSQAHIATGVPLDLGTNTQPSKLKHTNTHSENLHGLLPVLHRLDSWPAPVRPVTPVRPVDRAGQASGYSSRITSVLESLSDFSRLWKKTPPKHNLQGMQTLHKI
jgi:hypothetical protein